MEPGGLAGAKRVAAKIKENKYANELKSVASETRVKPKVDSGRGGDEKDSMNDKTGGH